MILRLAASAAIIAMLATAPALAAASANDIPAGISLSGAYLAGRSAAKDRDSGLATDYLSRALADDPENPLLVEKVFSLMLAEGQIAEGEKLAEKVLTFNTQHRMAHIVLGLRDFKAGKHDSARRHFQASGYTPLGELTATLLKAWSYAAENDLNLALKALDKLDANDSFTNFKLLHAALIADFLKNDIRAGASFKAASEAAPSSLRIAQAYGNFLERHGRADDARKIYEAFNDSRDPNPLIAEALAASRRGVAPPPFIASARDGAGEALFSLASAMTDDQSVEIGLMYAQMALKLNDDAPVVTTLIGDLYESMEQEERAIAAYDEVPPASALRGNSDIEIASNLHKLDRSPEAVDRLAALIVREPGNYSAIVTLGNIYRNNEDYKQASATYEKAITLLAQPAKEHWRVFYFAGISNERLKQWPSAEKYFRRALELSPDEASVLNYLGYSMIDMGVNMPEAIEMVKKAVEAKPNDGYIVDSLGWAYFKMRNYEESLIHLERAVELLPADPIIGEHLGDVYWRSGRTLEAKFQWQHAKDNKPEPEDLKRIEDKISNGLPEETPVTPAQNGGSGTNG